MVKATKGWRRNARLMFLLLILLAALLCAMLYKLGSLTGGLSAGEIITAKTPVGWHGIFNHPLDLPIKIVRSVVFYIFPDHGQTLTRLPNVVFGTLTVINFGILIWLWHGARTAFLTTLLFATSAWTLHVSRLASNDVLYLWAIPTLLLIQVLLHRYGEKAIIWYGSVLCWGLMLYIPGMIWIMLAQLFGQRQLIKDLMSEFSGFSLRLMSILAFVIWLPLLIYDLTRPHELVRWIGLPAEFPGIFTQIKHFLAVPVHLFIRGPQYPDLWLAKAPILDVFTLIITGLGIYFYIKNWQAARSRTLVFMFGVGVVVVGLGGTVGLSALVPFLYVAAAAGLAYLLHEWLKVFPRNPLARSLGIGLVTIAVGLSCIYNLRAYFVAWPHNTTTPPTFRYHR